MNLLESLALELGKKQARIYLHHLQRVELRCARCGKRIWHNEPHFGFGRRGLVRHERCTVGRSTCAEARA